MTLQSRSVFMASSNEPICHPVHGFVLQDASGLVFGPDESSTPKPISLLFSNAGLRSVVGMIRDIIVTDAVFGRLDFCDDTEAKSIEAKWDTGELAKDNLSLSLSLLESFTVPSGELFQGHIGPMLVARTWTIQAAILGAV